jgi:undecaprenyl diphosphate synthase
MDQEIVKEIKKGRLPVHIAVIMDGNGRWALDRGMPRSFGHKKGVESVREITTVCREIGIKILTLYSFSTENWRRPEKEVNYLMRILAFSLKKERSLFLKKGIRLNALGRIEELPVFVQKELLKTMDVTKKNSKMVLNLALNYGSRKEIADAVKKILKDILAVKKDLSVDAALNSIDEDIFAGYLYTGGLPDPDLLIRTGGEKRISNFLLWQSAYTELYFTDVYWPVFKREELYEALLDYQKRKRRYGGIKEI